MKLVVLVLLLAASTAEARRLPVCAKEATYPKDLPTVLCPSKIEKAPGGGQVLTFAITHNSRTAEEMAKMYAAALGQKKWKVTRSGTSLSARHGHDKVEISVAPDGTNAVVRLVYTPA